MTDDAKPVEKTWGEVAPSNDPIKRLDGMN
ncbi:hypothetical protein KR52_12480 [Synechococcus sp. KORDI-52]|nr:hypothetical protein KR52_12480 [Synechococcus sp. KORDI-52]